MLGVLSIHEPRSIAEASALLTEYGEDAAIYAGGTELIVIMKEGLVHFPHLVNIKTVPGLASIMLDDQQRVLRIGALATHRAIERSAVVNDVLPVLAELEAQVANVRVRSVGTLGGNLCFAEPHSDPATLLIALNATLTLASSRGERRIAAENFFVGLFATIRDHDEILTEIEIPVPTSSTSVAYKRFKTHERPTASVAVKCTVENDTMTDVRVVVGSVDERPVRIGAAEQLLQGERPGNDVFAAVANRVRDDVVPTEDYFESSDYKRHLAHTLAVRALDAATRNTPDRLGGDHAF